MHPHGKRRDHRMQVHPQGPPVRAPRVMMPMQTPVAPGAVRPGESAEPIGLSPAASLGLMAFDTLSVHVVVLEHAVHGSTSRYVPPP